MIAIWLIILHYTLPLITHTCHITADHRSSEFELFDITSVVQVIILDMSYYNYLPVLGKFHLGLSLATIRYFDSHILRTLPKIRNVFSSIFY